MDTVAIRLDAGTRRWAFAGFVVFAAGGFVLLVIAFGGFAAQTGSQRMYTAIFGTLCVAFATLVSVGLRRPGAVLCVDASGFSVAGPDGSFSVPWGDVSRVVLSREKRPMGRLRFWFYRLEWWSSAASPTYSFLLEEGRYGYALGWLGSARSLYAALSRFAPSRVLELRR